MAISSMLNQAAIAKKGWWHAHQWLLLRRISQISILGLFLLGPLTGLWIVKGNLSSSVILDTLPLTDPFLFLQTLAAGHPAASTAALGAALVTLFYLLVGRMYCSWVCPVNIVTDSAAWLRRKLGISGPNRLSRNTRYWMLAMVMVLATSTGVLVWEWLNPVTMLQRGLLFGMGLAWLIILAVFLFDLFMSPRAWCSHLCPMGAFYSLIGSRALLRVSAARRDQCNDCGECYEVCPEPQVIKPALKGAKQDHSPHILARECTNCARCIDICSERVFEFSSRFNNVSHDLANGG